MDGIIFDVDGTQYIEPGVLWSSGSDEFGRTAYERSLWIPEYYV